MEKIDYKKLYQDLYVPKTEPTLIEIPAMQFIMVDGQGNPNDVDGEYQNAVALLYALSYTIKMECKKMKVAAMPDYVVPPLEGLWWMNEENNFDFTQKEKYLWISMIRQPDFVNTAMFEFAKKSVQQKKPELDVTKAYLQTYTEGLCIQCMHIGSFDTESATIEKIDSYMDQIGRQSSINTRSSEGILRRHHEVYLSDPRKSSPERRKTVLRHPVI